MRILFLEDRGSVSVYITEKLKLDGHDVISAFDINDAQSVWERRGEEPIDCMIIDLNMRADGLKDHEMQQTMGGILTGWIWLREYVFKDQPDMRKRTLIFSDYLDLFRKGVAESEYKEVITIPKSAPYSSVEKLFKLVNDICARI
jgi:hypothetical protein